MGLCCALARTNDFFALCDNFTAIGIKRFESGIERRLNLLFRRIPGKQIAERTHHMAAAIEVQEWIEEILVV